VALPRAAASGNPGCSRYWDQDVATTLPPAYGRELPYVVCGYVPAQLRSAYGVAGSGLTGKGVTIAIVDPGASPTIASDAGTYFRRHGLPAFRPGQFTQYLPADIGQSCGTGLAPYGEESLDVEAAHTMAPGARIAFVASDCTSITDPLDAETRIVDGHLADIVSDSWHLGTEAQMPTGLVAAFEQVFEQGAIEGIGFYFSSGDHGDWTPATGGAPAVQYPGIDPWVTSVGGTSLAVSARGGYEWETGWGTDLAPLAADGISWTTLPGAFYGGAGGGTSTLFAQPFYQRGVVPAALARPAGAAEPMRVMPDIAADADPSTGMLIGLTMAATPTSPPAYTEGTAGGTSVATPLIAGVQADAEQALGRPIGFADPAIYARYGTRAYHDVTDDPLGPGVTIAAAVPNVETAAGTPTSYADTFARDTSLHATRGYDDVTGVGSPTAAYLRSYRRR
jgi:subtilase family serine protease